MRSIQLFHVGIKAIFLRRGRLLLVRERMEPGYWELPGGRIDVGEERLTPEDVLRRELREELGPSFRYRIGEPIRAWIRPPSPQRRHPAFLVGFRCTPVSGAIRLSDEHSEYRWIDREIPPLAPGYEPVIRSLIARR